MKYRLEKVMNAEKNKSIAEWYRTHKDTKYLDKKYIYKELEAHIKELHKVKLNMSQAVNQLKITFPLIIPKQNHTVKKGQLKSVERKMNDYNRILFQDTEDLLEKCKKTKQLSAKLNNTVLSYRTNLNSSKVNFKKPSNNTTRLYIVPYKPKCSRNPRKIGLSFRRSPYLTTTEKLTHILYKTLWDNKTKRSHKLTHSSNTTY